MEKRQFTLIQTECFYYRSVWQPVSEINGPSFILRKPARNLNWKLKSKSSYDVNVCSFSCKNKLWGEILTVKLIKFNINS